MAQCKWCDRSGWFMKVNQQGCCSNCAPAVRLEASQRLRVINESMALAQNGKTLTTRLSRADLVIEHASALSKYHDRGIQVLTVAPCAIIKEF
jgi:hypothetical protein